MAPVTFDNGADAEYALVTGGANRAATERLAYELGQTGLVCRIVCIHLIRPFPAIALGEAVAGLKGVLLIPGNDHILEATRRAIIEAGQSAPAVLHQALDDDDAVNAALQAFGLPADSPRKTTTTEDVSPIALTARPAGGWDKTFLLEAATRLAVIDKIGFHWEDSVLWVGRREMDSTPDAPIQVALCAHPSYLETGDLLGGMAEGGTVVVVSSGPAPGGWWNDLRPESRQTILERGLLVDWIDLGGIPDLNLADPAAVRTVALDGFLAAAIPNIQQTLEFETNLFNEATGLNRLDLRALEKTRLSRETTFEPTAITPPTMPAPIVSSAESSDDRWDAATGRFHLTGGGAHSASEPTLAEPLHPLVLDAADSSEHIENRYPMFLHGVGNDKVAQPFETCVDAALQKLETEGEAATILPQHLPRLSAAVGRVVGGNSAASDLVQQALEEFQRTLDLSDAGSATLRLESDRLRQQLDGLTLGSTLVGLDKTTLQNIYAAAVRNVRRPRRKQLLEEIGTLIQRLEELLAIDDGHAPEQLGGGAGEFLDSQKLAANLPHHRGPVRLGLARRQRIEQTLTTLRDARDDDDDFDLVLVQPESGRVGKEIKDVRIVVHPNGLEAAIGLFDGLTERYAELFRALRVARLEVDGAYDATLHDAPLSRFGWQGMTNDELLSLPRLVVFESAERLHGASLGAFSELLRSGRPLHVLVAQSTSEFRAATTWQGLTGFHPGLGYVAVAHREAFVVESSLVCPERLVDDLGSMATSLRPGAALVAVPAWNSPVSPWTQLQAAKQARAIPSFIYDPEAGSNWAARFNLHGNPQPSRPWPVHAVRYHDNDGTEQTLDQSFTFAHAVALDPAYRGHFRIVPVEAWSTNQIEIADYLAAPPAAVERRIPYIWIVVNEGQLARALVTRELAYACRDRARAWRILQELAGTDNEYARRAAEVARTEEQAEAQTQRVTRDAEYTAELERVRAETAGEAMDRLARVLMDLDAVPLPAQPTATATAQQPEPLVEERQEETVDVEDEEEDGDASFNDPYVTSALCTSCRECIDINAQLFRYDANKQAFITDASNGTFEDLVKAAENCPARCIHPGLPIAGDETANDGLLERAARFN